ncbi:Receptor-type tyrosine-protein phosphatase F [Takifugu flavidus]|uniref:Receptor-type tyrosine-protein phosphatase F n=1 Tax=Takifugu flavidus TaxID=433684 RepID=A0A5C6P2B2_9TELE|nr:Receptor-type tyrosine-protein phosphatase F [Takifugu flavidus]
MVPKIHLAVPLSPRGALPFLFLLSCMVFLSLAESLPSFVKSPEDQTGISGGVASFVCQATGEPKPRITWMKKGKKVSSQRFEVIEFDDGSGSVLRIQPLRTHRDEAIYECTATNSLGEINTSAKLTVLEGQLRMPLGESDLHEPPFCVVCVIYVDRDAACSVFHIAEL